MDYEFMNVKLLPTVFPLLVILGCSSVAPRVPEPTLDSVHDQVADSPNVKPIDFWILKSDFQPRMYNSLSSIVLDLAADSGIKRDSMTIRTQYSLKLDRTKSATSLAGRVDLFSIEAGTRTGFSLPVPIPLSFTGSIAGGQVTITPDSPLQSTGPHFTCPNSWSTVTAGVQRNLYLVPSRISRGTTWNDSTSSTTCHGSTPVLLKILYRYNVIGEVDNRGVSVILIERTGNSSFSGRGSEGQHTILIEGKGSIADRFHIDRDTGLFLEAQSHQVIKLFLTLSGKRQEFTQTIRESVLLVKQ